MKIITKNLTGVTPSGERFRIRFETKPCDVVKGRRFVYLFLEIELYGRNKFWFKADVVAVHYDCKEDFKAARLEAFIKAESQFNIKLLTEDVEGAA